MPAYDEAREWGKKRSVALREAVDFVKQRHHGPVETRPYATKSASYPYREPAQ